MQLYRVLPEPSAASYHHRQSKDDIAGPTRALYVTALSGATEA